MINWFNPNETLEASQVYTALLMYRLRCLLVAKFKESPVKAMIAELLLDAFLAPAPRLPDDLKTDYYWRV